MMNTISIIIYGVVMGIIGFLIGYNKAEKYFIKYYEENFILTPIDEMLDDLYSEEQSQTDDEAQYWEDYNNFKEKPNPKEFLNAFEDFLEDVPND